MPRMAHAPLFYIHRVVTCEMNDLCMHVSFMYRAVCGITNDH
jgi:hypothetical protein